MSYYIIGKIQPVFYQLSEENNYSTRFDLTIPILKQENFFIAGKTD